MQFPWHQHPYNIEAYFDKQVDKKTAEEIKKHLQKCPECQQRYQVLKNVRTFLREGMLHKLSVQQMDNFWPAIQKRLTEQKEDVSQAAVRWLRSVAFLSAAAAAVIFLTIKYMITDKPLACVIQRIETPYTNVMVLNPPDKKNMTVIWLFETNTQKGSPLS